MDASTTFVGDEDTPWSGSIRRRCQPIDQLRQNRLRITAKHVIQCVAGGAYFRRQRGKDATGNEDGIGERPVRLGLPDKQAPVPRLARQTDGPTPLARQARIQGLVRLEAVIGEDGAIRELRALSGHPLLVPAALSAVKQWRYRPTLLNGRPVPVITQVEVRFTLSG